MGQLNGVGEHLPETPEQAVASIISALDFLAQEAEAVGAGSSPAPGTKRQLFRRG